MASCLVPEFPAITVALQHLKELDQLLKEEGTPFSPEANLHLNEIMAAVTELEADRRAAHEDLEVETLENSKLRLQISDLREQMKQVILSDVASAQASKAEEMEQLHQELSKTTRLRKAAEERQLALTGENAALQAEQEQVKAEQEAFSAALSDQITVKRSLQVQLDQTRQEIEELKSCIANVEQKKLSLQKNMDMERQSSKLKKDNLARELEQIEEQIKRQRELIRENQEELDRINEKKQESCERLGELSAHMAKLKSSEMRLAASHHQCDKQLKEEGQGQLDLQQQRERLKEEIGDSGKTFTADLQLLREKIASLEAQIEEGKATRIVQQNSFSHIFEVFKQQQDEEKIARAEHLRVSEQLKRSKLQLEQHIASIAKHQKETKEMDRQISLLLEINTVNERAFERKQEVLINNIDGVKNIIQDFQEKKRCVIRLLEEATLEQQETMAKMTTNVSDTRRRYKDLQQEEAKLLLQHPMSADTDQLLSHIAQSESEYRQIQTTRLQEIQQCNAEIDNIERINRDKQREVEEVEVTLKEVEAKYNQEQSRHQRLEILTRQLQRRRQDLELLVQELTEKSSLLLRTKDEKKAALLQLQGDYLLLLHKQASELKCLESNIYNDSVKLEEVRLENSRLHLCIRQMKEDLSRCQESRGRNWQDIHRFNRDTQVLMDNIRKGWREDVLLTQHHQNSDSGLLVSMNALINTLKTRRSQLGKVATLLHQQMPDKCKQLGDESNI